MRSEPLVVTFADAGYLPLLSPWLQRVRALGLRRVRVYALDRQTTDWCESQQVETVELSWSGKLHDLWCARIRVFSALLVAGEELIHSDTDAIWLQNPLHNGSASRQTADLLFSQGTVWPHDVHDRWGFVLCCGWFWARPTTGARAFFAALERDVQLTGDDQVSVNRLLAGAGARWSGSGAGEYQLALGERKVQCWSQPLTATLDAAALTVALLPHREFQRLPDVSAPAIVKHYLTPKNCEQKLRTLRALGLMQ